MSSLQKIISYKLIFLLLIFLGVHVLLFNINAAEWGDSYRILRSAEFLKRGAYPPDEKRQPLLALALATRPTSQDPTSYGRFVLFVFSLLSFILFYFLLSSFIKDSQLVFWGMLAFLFNNVFLYWSLRVMTDVPYGFFVILAIYIYQKNKDQLNFATLFLIGIVCGLATLTRFEGYLLFAAFGLGVALTGFKFNLTYLKLPIIKQKFIQLLPFILGYLILVGPYLYFRDPLASTYFEEPANRQYGFKMLATYILSFMCLFGVIPVFYLCVKSSARLYKIFVTNLPMCFYVLLELLLILAWPAAVPRLFVPIIPFLLIAAILSVRIYFEQDERKKSTIHWLMLSLAIYIVGQYWLKLQFLILDRRLFVVDIVLQLLLIYFLVKNKKRLFYIVSVVAMMLWSGSIIYMHKDIFISIKSGAAYAGQTLTGNIGYNDVSSVSDWYINYQYKKAKTAGFYYNTEKKRNLELAPLQAAKIDYLLITNEHNTTMTLDLNKRPYLKELRVFSYKVNGQTFVTRIVKVL